MLFFSLEMSQLELTQRMLCSEARVDSKQACATASLTEADWRKIAHATGRLAEAPIWIDDNPNLTIMEIRSKARRLKAALGDLGLVVVDYLQLMTGRVQRREPPGRGVRDQPWPQDPRPRARVPGAGAVAALPRPRDARRQAPDAGRPARVGLPHRRHLGVGVGAEQPGVGGEAARLAEVGEHRALVGALLEAAVELGEGDDRALELAGEDLQATADLGHLDLAVLGAGPAGHQLDVVDDDQAEVADLALAAGGPWPGSP